MRRIFLHTFEKNQELIRTKIAIIDIVKNMRQLTIIEMIIAPQMDVRWSITTDSS